VMACRGAVAGGELPPGVAPVSHATSRCRVAQQQQRKRGGRRSTRRRWRWFGGGANRGSGGGVATGCTMRSFSCVHAAASGMRVRRRGGRREEGGRWWMDIVNTARPSSSSVVPCYRRRYRDRRRHRRRTATATSGRRHRAGVHDSCVTRYSGLSQPRAAHGSKRARFREFIAAIAATRWRPTSMQRHRRGFSKAIRVHASHVTS
jgi:hypothetical protein